MKTFDPVTLANAATPNSIQLSEWRVFASRVMGWVGSPLLGCLIGLAVGVDGLGWLAGPTRPGQH